MIKRLALMLAMSGMLMVAKADTVTQLYSSATTTTNNSGNPTQNIDTNPAWAGPFSGSSWVSYASTGNPSDSGFYTVPNGTAVTFQETFTLNGPITSASLHVLADDTASVILNGWTIYSANLSGPYPTCSASPIGCLSSTAGNFGNSQLLPYLNANGVNTLDFVVYQKGGSSYGLDYVGSVTTTPEPGTMVLLGVGMLGLALLKLRS